MTDTDTDTLTATRRDLAARLRGVLPAEVVVMDHWPERVDAPCALIAAGDPYLDREGVTFGSWRIRHEVTLVAGVATNATATDALDALVTALLVGMGEDVTGVSRPEMLTAANAQYITATVRVADVIRLTRTA